MEIPTRRVGTLTGKHNGAEGTPLSGAGKLEKNNGENWGVDSIKWVDGE